MTGRWHHLAIGGLISLVVVLATAKLSTWPDWQSVPDDHALIRLSFTQSGVKTCRDRTPEELAALPRNMRQSQICDRRRADIYVEMELNGTPVLAEHVPPTGISGSGPSRVYRGFELPAGTYDIALRLRDNPALDGFTSETTRQVQLAPGESLAIDYDPSQGGFFIH